MRFFPPDGKSGVSATALTTNRKRSRWANTLLSHLQKRGFGVKSAAQWWLMASIPRRKSRKKNLNRKTQTVKTFVKRWLTDIVEKSNRDPRNITRVIEKDIVPIIGKLELEELTTAHIQVVLDRIKQRGSDHVALLTRNVLKRMLAYAISRGIIFNNPAAAIEARYIAQATSRDVALTAEEIGILLRGIYTSNMNRRHKLALHLLIICMVRKSELIEATWSEVNFNALEWLIPGERMKMDNSHIVPLSKQALAIFE